MTAPSMGVRGPRTRALLILAMSIITMGTTLVSLSAIRSPLQDLIVQNITSELLHSLAIFESMQEQQMTALDRENALLADLPSLKALMTTSDTRTISDAGVEFWKVSGEDLFALADRDGDIKAAYLARGDAGEEFRAAMHRFVERRTARYLVSAQGLYVCSVQPIYFGSRESGTLLGYVISGIAIENNVEMLSSATNVQALFRSGTRELATSPAIAGKMPASTTLPADTTQPARLTVGGEQFLAVAHDLSPRATAPLTLVEFKSLAEEDRAIREINRLVLLAGLLALVLGAALMLALSRLVTRPLEQLAAGVRAFASGDSSHLLPYRGTREVRELSNAFARMRREILQANRDLLESERLATIGRMARSVSHDLRHYLSAIYANSEFLASGTLPADERNDVLAEIRTAVDGTTEMLESLLMFSRTGTPMRRTRQSIAALADRALNLVHAHPDAAGVSMTLSAENALASEACVDGKQLERALYNLLLNGCQAARDTGVHPAVKVSIDARDEELDIEFADNGIGVPSSIRATLFDPFVSEGKHKGSGLGLTLAQAIAADHGGSVVLVSSRRGETIFRMNIARACRDEESQTVGRAEVG
jgi:signal transduction histidine kinase